MIVLISSPDLINLVSRFTQPQWKFPNSVFPIKPQKLASLCLLLVSSSTLAQLSLPKPSLVLIQVTVFWSALNT